MRIQSIDYLRGLMSLSVVMYHFTITFTNWGMTDSGTILGRLGIYAVSAFYIISGMALYLSQKNESWNVTTYSVFMLRRFLRLAPIYWLGLIVLTIFCLQYYGDVPADNWKITQNVFLMFGAINPSEYMLMGGWSIGNEVVFYLLFPIFILMANGRGAFITLALLSMAIFAYCAAFYLNPSLGLVPQWKDYINPFNQVYFFVFGIISAKCLLPHVGKQKGVVFLVAVAVSLAFVFYPVNGDQINIIIGWNKFVFTAIIVLLCSMFFLLGDLTRLKGLHFPLKFMGDVSYPLYLLHGVSFLYFKKFFYLPGVSNEDLVIRGLGLLLVMLLMSWVCHVFIEKTIIKLSRSINQNKMFKLIEK